MAREDRVKKTTEEQINNQSNIGEKSQMLFWHAPTKDTTSYVRVKDSLASGAGGR